MPSFLGVIGTFSETFLEVIVVRLVDETVGGPTATTIGDSIPFVACRQPAVCKAAPLATAIYLTVSVYGEQQTGPASAC